MTILSKEKLIPERREERREEERLDNNIYIHTNFQIKRRVAN